MNVVVAPTFRTHIRPWRPGAAFKLRRYGRSTLTAPM